MVEWQTLCKLYGRGVCSRGPVLMLEFSNLFLKHTKLAPSLSGTGCGYISFTLLLGQCIARVCRQIWIINNFSAQISAVCLV